MRSGSLAATILVFALGAVSVADTLDDVKARGALIWGADSEGGGPYVYPDPDNPRKIVGFEAELVALLAKDLGVKPRFYQAPWDNLPALLKTRQIDIVLNGFELTAGHLATMDATHPYYVYQLALLTRGDDNRIDSWDDLARDRKEKFKVGVLGTSGAYDYLNERFANSIEIVRYDGNTNAMQDVVTGRLDATLADLPIAIFYRDRFPKLHQAAPPAGHGYYAIFVRKGDAKLRAALNASLVRVIKSGQLKNIYERYGIWSAAQEELLPLATGQKQAAGIRATALRGWKVIESRGGLLVQAAGITLLLAVISMPIAIAIGLLIAIGRLYGPAPLRWLLVGYVELLRGTPLMLQLFVIFFLLPEIGISIPPFYAAIIGLAVNYSAYEAEIYRAGLQAIPRGQMEAALALGMTPALALRRVVVPQAVRIVLPPVTSDFIALFKDTSVCSAITVVELTKEYNIQVNDTGATLELAALTAILYLAMSVPLAHVASRMEKRMRKQHARA